jgi:hypothetical protein
MAKGNTVSPELSVILDSGIDKNNQLTWKVNNMEKYYNEVFR